MNNKTKLSLAALCLAPLISFAGGPAAMADSNNNHFYIGANAGLNVGHSQFGTSVSLNIPGSADISADASAKAGHVGPTAGLQLGFDHSFASNLHLGVYGHFNLDNSYSDNKYSINITPATFPLPIQIGVDSKIEYKQNYGLDAYLGFDLIPRATTYFSLGWGWMRVDSSNRINVLSTNLESLNRTFNGPSVGGGINMNISRHFSAGVNYSYTFYRQQSRTANYTIVAPAGSINLPVKISLKPGISRAVATFDYIF